MGFWRSVYYWLNWDYVGTREQLLMSAQHTQKEKVLKELADKFRTKNVDQQQRECKTRKLYSDVVSESLILSTI